MQLNILGSSSSGNFYLLKSNSGQILMLECGVLINEIKVGINFNFYNVVGCLLSHEHGDHAKSHETLMRYGVDLYTSAGTARALAISVDNHRLKKIAANDILTIGEFRILAFKVEHDCAEPLGFIINHPESGNILFITDSFYVSNTFKNIHNIMIEANFSDAIVKERMANGYLPDYRANRLFKSHMSLETCIKTLQANDLSQVQKIILLHLSDGNSNAEYFKNEVIKATGKPVTIADKGVKIEHFNQEPF